MNVTLSPLAGAGWQFFNNNGVPLSGGLLYSYAAGTSTQIATYTSVAGNVANSNPIVLDAAGRVSSEIWITVGSGYKFVLQDSSANLIGTWDNIPSNAQSPFPNDASGIAYEQGYTVTAGSFVVGNKYMIATVGTTDFVSIGATSNTVGVYFTATGVGSGTGTAELSQSVQTKLQENVSVKDFGAKGDGVTNDTAAFVAASNYINAQSGGKLVVPAGTYIVGEQTFAGATGKGYAYQGSNIISIKGCTNPVVIEFQGAILKMASGLKFGSFDPVTGAAYYPASLPFTNYDYQASLSFMIYLYENNNVSVIGSVELDGNNNNVVLGGQWGDTGYQIVAYGIWAYNNQICTINNVYTHNHCLDGIASGFDGLTSFQNEARPITLINVVSTNNARQGWSITGGKGVTAINCAFNNTGKSIPFSSSPGAGVDIESEGGWAEDIVFIDCEFTNNIGNGLVADSGTSKGVTCIRCKFVGTTSSSIWPRKPRMAFYDCLIVGTAVNAYASTTNPDDATKFFNCLFTDDVSYSYTGTVYNEGFLANFESGANVLLDNCTFYATQTLNLNIKSGGYVRNCTFVCQAGTAYIANQSYIAIIWSSTIENLTILDQITVGVPADGYYVNFSNTSYKGTNFISGSNIKWWSWSAGAGGASGYLGQSDPSQVAYPYLSVIKGAGSALLGYYGTADTYWGTAAPTTGTFKQGDRFFNSTPSVGQPKSWVCTVAGTPGTWVSEGNL